MPTVFFGKKLDATKLTDAELLLRFNEGSDQCAFAELIRRHGPMVYATVRRTLKSSEDAEDAAQATFFALAKRGKSIRNKEVIGAWLHRVAVLSSAEVRRKNLRWHDRMKTKSELIRQEKFLSSDGLEPSARVASKELTKIIDTEITRLPEKQRKAIVLCDLQGLTQKQAAKHLGIAASTVNDHVVKGRKTLNARLSKRGFALTVTALTALGAATKKASAGLTADRIATLTSHSTLYAIGDTVGNGLPSSASHLANRVITSMKLTILSKLAVAVLVVTLMLSSLPGINTGVQSALAQETFSDDFEGGFGGEWEIAKGSGSIEFENGKMVIFADTAGVLVRPISSNGSRLQYDDVTIDLEATIPDGLNANVGIMARADFSKSGTFGLPFGLLAGYDTDNEAQFFSIGSAGAQALNSNDSIFEVEGQLVRSRLDVRGKVLEFESWPVGRKPTGYHLADESIDHTLGEIGLWVRPFGGDVSLGVEFDNITVAREPLSFGVACDFDNNQSCDVGDIDQLLSEIAAGTDTITFDLNGDRKVDNLDRDEWLKLAASNNGFNAPYLAGDSNLDGRVDSADLNQVGLNWQRTNVQTWGDGDFNGDGRVDSADLNEVGLNWQRGGDQAAPVPEPNGFTLALVACFGITWLSRSVSIDER